MLLVRSKQSLRRRHPHAAALRFHHLKNRRERKRSLKDASQSKNSKPKRNELVYLDQSPNYCEENSRLGSLGTRGRRCFINRRELGFNRSLTGQEESCDILCCGRGYNTHQIHRSWKCRCKFRWCCEVHCQNCQESVEIYTCNWKKNDLAEHQQCSSVLTNL